jgi:hypothetical protein
MMTCARTYLAMTLIGLPLVLPANAGFLDFIPEAPQDAAPISRYPGGRAYERAHFQEAKTRKT